MIKFNCTGCKTPHTANASFAGLTAMCTKCGAKFRIPRPTAKEQVAPEDDFDLGDELAVRPVEIQEESVKRPVPIANPEDLPEVACPRCDHDVENPQDYLGEHHRCRSCGHPFMIPANLPGYSMMAGAMPSMIPPFPSIGVPPPSVAPQQVAFTYLPMRPLDESDKTLDQIASEMPEPRNILEPTEIDEFSQLDPGEPVPVSDQKKKQKQRLIIAGLLLLIGIVSYFAFFSEQPKPKIVIPPLQEEDPPPPPEPLPPPPPELPYEFVGPPEPIPVPIQINAERLYAEMNADLGEANASFEGKFLEVRGNCARFLRDRLSFSGENVTLQDASIHITAILPEYTPRFVHPETGKPIVPIEGIAVIGGTSAVSLQTPDVRPIPGQPVTVTGYFNSGYLRKAKLIKMQAPADDLYKGKSVALTGKIVGYSENRDWLQVSFAKPKPPYDKLSITVSPRFRKSMENVLKNWNLEQTAMIVGKCSGRMGTEVVLENCSIQPVEDENAGLPLWQFQEAYEVDLKKYPAIPANLPVIHVSDTELLAAYNEDRRAANSRFKDRILEVTASILRSDPKTYKVQFESPTDSFSKLAADFIPQEFAAIPLEEPRIVFRGEFRGLPKGERVINLENCIPIDPELNDTKSERVTPDYLPLTPGRRWQAIRVMYPDPIPVPSKPKPGTKPQLNLATTMLLGFERQQQNFVAVSVLNTGTFNGMSILDEDAPAIVWQNKKDGIPNTPSARPLEVYKLRMGRRFIELGAMPVVLPGQPPIRPAPGLEDPTDTGVTWQPLVKVGARKGKSWEFEDAGGQMTRTTVESFFRDGLNRECVRLVSVTSAEAVTKAKVEVVVVLARGVGEISRVTSIVTPKGSRVIQEQKLVGDVLGTWLERRLPALEQGGVLDTQNGPRTPAPAPRSLN